VKELGVIRFIIRKKVPFDAIDSVEFADMLQDFGVALDRKSGILGLIQSLFEFTLEVRAKRLRTCSALSVAVDFWTSKSHRKYMSMSYFGITDGWQMEADVMDFCSLPRNHNCRGLPRCCGCPRTAPRRLRPAHCSVYV
jgi:hypothetical protein